MSENTNNQIGINHKPRRCAEEHCPDCAVTFSNYCYRHTKNGESWSKLLIDEICPRMEPANLPEQAKNAFLFGVNLSGTNLRNAQLVESELTRANLESSSLANANLTGANFTDANLKSVDFFGSDLIDVDFFGANLRGAVFLDADLKGAKFNEADLTDADFRGAKNLSFAFFHNAKFNNTQITFSPLCELERARQDLPPPPKPALNEADTTDNAKKTTAPKPKKLPVPQNRDRNEDRFQIPETPVFGEERIGDLVAAQNIYRELKNNFTQMGQHRQAEWADYRAHQLRIKSLYNDAFFDVKNLYPEQIECFVQHKSDGKVTRKLYEKYGRYSRTKHFRYLGERAMDLFFGFGYKPMRLIWWAVGWILLWTLLNHLAAGSFYFNFRRAVYGFLGVGGWEGPFMSFVFIEAAGGIFILAVFIYCILRRIMR